MSELLSDEHVRRLIYDRSTWPVGSLGSTARAPEPKPDTSKMSTAERLHRARLANPPPVRGKPRKL